MNPRVCSVLLGLFASVARAAPPVDDALEQAERSERVADYESAAASFERHFALHPSATTAPRALEEAIFLRSSLGDDSAADADTSRFIRAYGATRREDAARVVLARAIRLADAERWADLERDLPSAMSLIDRGPVWARMQGHAIGGRAHAARGNDTQAAAEYVQVRSLGSQLDAAPIPSDPAELRKVGRAWDALGEALFFAADARRLSAPSAPFPIFAGPALPTDTAVDAWIARKVRPWLAAETARIATLEAEYLPVVTLKYPPPHWEVLAAARVAALWTSAFDASVRPRGSIHGKKALADALVMLRASSKRAAEQCIAVSVKLQWREPEAAHCADWLAKTFPDERMTIDELLPRPPAARGAAPVAEPARSVRP